MYDLRIFLTYYLILLCFFGIALNVLSDSDMDEYKKLPISIKHSITVLRMAIGNP